MNDCFVYIDGVRYSIFAILEHACETHILADGEKGGWNITCQWNNGKTTKTHCTQIEKGLRKLAERRLAWERKQND